MNSEEYDLLDRNDREHWFYKGKRAIVRHWTRRYLSLEAEDVWVDAGCGAGTLPPMIAISFSSQKEFNNQYIS